MSLSCVALKVFKTGGVRRSLIEYVRSSFSDSSLRARIASVSRLSAKSIKSRIRVLEGDGISRLFLTESATDRRFMALGVRGDLLACKIREASSTVSATANY
jgi:hypothetical protein